MNQAAKMLLIVLTVLILSGQSVWAVNRDKKAPSGSSKTDEKPVHSPHKATVYSAVLPGLGQIYNKKYWKLPILYGGFAALAYSIHWNNNYYVKYKKAYSDIADDDPTTNSFKDLDIEGHWDFSDPSQVSQFETRLKNAKEASRRYRDMCIIGTVALYALNIIDATVDAHFFDFNISGDLSMNWTPTTTYYAMNEQNIIGFHCVFRF